MNDDCQHKRLYFGSGDYYLFCKDCTQFWDSSYIHPVMQDIYSGDRVLESSLVEWKDSEVEKPPKYTEIWAYCMYYGCVSLCKWYGDLNDDEYPYIQSIERDDGDNNHFRFWTLARVPDPPSEMIDAST